MRSTAWGPAGTAGVGRILATGALSAVLAAGLVSAAAAGDADPRRRLTFFVHPTELTPIDLAPAGPSTGDLLVEHGTVFDREGGKRIGRFTATCTTLTASAGVPADTACTLDALLPDGQLYVRGLSTTERLFSGKATSFGVVGGTDRYREARGDGTIRVRNETDGLMSVRLN